MAYFIGSALERKIQEFDLSDLNELLESISLNKPEAEWPIGGFIIPAQPYLLDATRVVLYSMLHRFGLKGQFTVKADYTASHLTIDRKDQAGHHRQHQRIGGMIRTFSSHPHYSPQAEISAQPEDLSSCFEETTSFSDGDK